MGFENLVTRFVHHENNNKTLRIVQLFAIDRHSSEVICKTVGKNWKSFCDGAEMNSPSATATAAAGW
jgi:hypothetical protein